VMRLVDSARQGLWTAALGSRRELQLSALGDCGGRMSGW
jgi:hypothetical protein